MIKETATTCGVSPADWLARLLPSKKFLRFDSVTIQCVCACVCVFFSRVNTFSPSVPRQSNDMRRGLIARRHKCVYLPL